MPKSKLSKFDKLNNMHQNSADKISERSASLELFVLNLLATRIRQIGEGVVLTNAQMEADLAAIAKQLHAYEILMKADINRLLELTIKETYKSSQIYYEMKKMEYLPFDENKPLYTLLKQFKTEVLNDTSFHTQAFMIRNPKNRKELIPTSLSETYNEVIHEAAEQVASGQGDYTSAIRETTRTLVDNGMKTVDYDTESGKPYAQSTESAVSRNIGDAVRDINQKAQDEVGRQFGADGKEITVHEHSAPDHEPIQGHQFSNEEYEKLQNGEAFEDYKGRKFEPIKRHIGQYNCKHFTYSIVLGINKPNFTDEELQENIDRNHEGYTDKNGKHRTMYECTQEQRRLERLIKRCKMGVMVAKESGDIELARDYQQDVDFYIAQYKEFSEACGLPMKPERFYVEGYKRVKI